MKKIRELIETKLENAKLDLANKHYSNKDGLIGNIEAYQDLLALIPKPRTEQEILKDFEKLEYEVVRNDDGWLELEIVGTNVSIMICKLDKSYDLTGEPLTVQEHKLLNELFGLWGWI